MIDAKSQGNHENPSRTNRSTTDRVFRPDQPGDHESVAFPPLSAADQCISEGAGGALLISSNFRA